jgi:hypothetical protein
MHSLHGFVRYTVIVNTEAHDQPGSHWVAVHLDTRFSSSYYFDPYGLFPLVPAIRDFLRLTCAVWGYNDRTLQGFATDVCGEYACLFAACVDRVSEPARFAGLFGTCEPDSLVESFFERRFGRLRRVGSGFRGGQCCTIRQVSDSSTRDTSRDND